MSRLNAREWDLAAETMNILAADLGRTDADLARILGARMAELRPIVGTLYGLRRVDRCREYVVLSPRFAEGRRAA